MQLTKRRENKAKLDLANRTDKTDAAQKEIVEWEAKVQRCQHEFEEISKEIKKEMERFDIKRVNEFKSIIIKYLEDQMAHQQQVIACAFVILVPQIDIYLFISFRFSARQILGRIYTNCKRNSLKWNVQPNYFFIRPKIKSIYIWISIENKSKN